MWIIIGTMLYLIILSVLDIREKKVPVIPLAGGMLFALAVGMTEATEGGMKCMEIAGGMILGILPGGFMLGMAYFSGKAGYGDGVLLIIMGILNGYLAGIILLCMSLFILSAFSVCLLILRKADRHTSIPYIPFLTIAYICYQFFERRC